MMTEFLKPGRFIDSDAPQVVQFAVRVAGSSGSDVERVLRLYHTIRDDIVYDPYVDFLDPINYRASAVLAAGRGFCVGKAALLSACARSCRSAFTGMLASTLRVSVPPSSSTMGS